MPHMLSMACACAGKKEPTARPFAAADSAYGTFQTCRCRRRMSASREGTDLVQT